MHNFLIRANSLWFIEFSVIHLNRLHAGGRYSFCARSVKLRGLPAEDVLGPTVGVWDWFAQEVVETVVITVAKQRIKRLRLVGF